MNNYWFRICFEKEFESKKEAEEYLDEQSDLVWEIGTKNMSCECEERKDALSGGND